jgi:hypothetical protein
MLNMECELCEIDGEIKKLDELKKVGGGGIFRIEIMILS